MMMKKKRHSSHGSQRFFGLYKSTERGLWCPIDSIPKKEGTPYQGQEKEYVSLVEKVELADPVAFFSQGVIFA